MRSWWPCLIALLLGAVPTGCRSKSGDDSFRHLEGEIFATHYRVVWRGRGDRESIRAAIERELHRIDRMASTWKADSELMRYNRAADKEGFPLSAELAGLLERSREIKEQTGGAFDIGYDGRQLDLSAIAKGYAVDRVVELMIRDFGVGSCMVDIGGEVKVHGPGPQGEFWNVGVYIPRAAGLPDVALPRLALRDTSIATSGTTFKGEHLIDPHTGKPARHRLLSASAIHPSNTTADALATALFVMGPELGMQWARNNGIHVLFVLADGSTQECRPGD